MARVGYCFHVAITKKLLSALSLYTYLSKMSSAIVGGISGENNNLIFLSQIKEEILNFLEMSAK